MMTMNAASAPSPALPWVKDTDTAGFRQDVLSESNRQPVLVDFWAPWCGPCKQLTPVIEKAVQAAGGKVKLVKLNIEEHPQIAGQLGIQSIPAVIAFQRGQPIDGFVGALPESQVRGFIERLVGPIADAAADLIAEAEALAAAGDDAAAGAIFARVLAQDPTQTAALAGKARLEVQRGDSAAAQATLDQASAKARQDPKITAVQALIDIAAQASGIGDIGELQRKIAADPKDFQARFDLALALNQADRRDEAADGLLEIIKADRKWEDDGARKQLVQFFDAWGQTDAATQTARRKLSALLFS
ncbi:MAG: thioredoxin [Hyphomicrobiales bacterium]|nr:thioredoxin [Hyphomicrobiales bacterium]